MRKQRERDTGIERALRSRLHARGLRYRVHLRVLKGLRREADVVFTRAQVAVFVDGCFWHGCPEHWRPPKSNPDYWVDKIDRNRERDRLTDELLRAEGWASIRVWEHEPADRVIGIVEAALSESPR